MRRPALDGKKTPKSRSLGAKIRRAIFILTWVTVGVGLIAGGGVAYVIAQQAQDLPDHAQLADYQPPVVTRLYTGSGQVFAEFSEQKRIFVPIEFIPPLVLQSFISAEDRLFYKHPGVNPFSIARALATNIAQAGKNRRPVGASTITQQVAKNFFLSNEVSIQRKIKEALLALRIERVLSKQQILELYLNEIYLGRGAYGVAAAALHYFDKALDELTLAECAFLAALPKAPANYDPKRHYAAAMGRRNWVLSRLVADGQITAAVAARTQAQAIITQKAKRHAPLAAGYFAEEVRRTLFEIYGAHTVTRQGLSVRTSLDSKLQNMAHASLWQGLTAYDRRHGWRGSLGRIPMIGRIPMTQVTQDHRGWRTQLKALSLPPGDRGWRLALVTASSLQQAEILLKDDSPGLIPKEELAWARPALAQGKLGPMPAAGPLQPGDIVYVAPLADTNAQQSDAPPRYSLQQVPNVQGAIVAMNPHNGRVLAMVGGRSYRESMFNRATQAWRQAGSAFKPIVYLTALENGFTPVTSVLDAPLVIDQGAHLDSWKPRNYAERFYGPTTLRVGLEESRNLITVRVAQEVGIEKIAERGQDLGVFDAVTPALSLALGARETTLLRLMTAYAIFVNGGKGVTPSFVDRIQNRHGRTIYRHDRRICSRCQEPWYRQAAPRPRDHRPQVIDPRRAYQLVSMLEGVVAHGTGRSLRSLARPIAGKTGTTNNEQDAWFVGFSPDLVVGVYVGFDLPKGLGEKETGGRVAAPIFRSFMAQALKDSPILPFRVPSGLSFVAVDRKSGALSTRGAPGALIEALLPQEAEQLARLGTNPQDLSTGGLY